MGWVGFRLVFFYMNDKTRISITRLSAVFVGFIIWNIDKFISYSRIQENIVVIIFQTIIYRVILPLIISLFFWFFSEKRKNAWLVFKCRFINYVIVGLMIIVIWFWISVDAWYKIKVLDCTKGNQTIENQRNCIESLKINRFNLKSIFTNE